MGGGAGVAAAVVAAVGAGVVLVDRADDLVDAD
jgi:hypothetical protein